VLRDEAHANPRLLSIVRCGRVVRHRHLAGGIDLAPEPLDEQPHAHPLVAD
jgi:hypothetical protein